jgi:transposase
MTRPSNSSDLTDLEWLLLEPLMPAPCDVERNWERHAVRVAPGSPGCRRTHLGLWISYSKIRRPVASPFLPQRGIVERNFAWLGRRRRLRKN